jgi:hypothetical protein
VRQGSIGRLVLDAGRYVSGALIVGGCSVIVVNGQGSVGTGPAGRVGADHLDRNDGAAAEAGLIAVLVADGHRLGLWIESDERGDGGYCLRVAHDGQVEVVASGCDPTVDVGLVGVVERQFGLE